MSACQHFSFIMPSCRRTVTLRVVKTTICSSVCNKNMACTVWACNDKSDNEQGRPAGQLRAHVPLIKHKPK